MFEPTLHVPNHSGGLEPSAFHTQLRRLESMRTLMSQGSVVVDDVAQFMIKAREELAAFQRDQLSCVEVQQTLASEKVELLQRIEELTALNEQSELLIREKEMQISRLKAELAAQNAASAERERAEPPRLAEEKLAAALVRVATLEAERAEFEKLDRRPATAAEGNALGFAAEIAVLKARVEAMEHQLEAERERRIRLMEVMKTREVQVVSPVRQREVAS